MKKSVEKGEKCVLYDRECIGCGECEFCDLDPLKICDNCGKCLNLGDYAAFKIDSVDGVPVSELKRSHDHDDCDCGYHSHDHGDCDCDDHDCGGHGVLH